MATVTDVFRVPAFPSVCAPTEHARDCAHAWLVRLMHSDGPGIIRMLWRLLGNEADVMDAYQDCCCKLATRNVAELDNVRAYAYRAASNIAIEMLRARGRRNAHIPAVAATQDARRTPDTLTHDHPEIQQDDLRRALATLPPHLRTVIVLRDLSRLPYKEVGQILGIDAATARVYRRHAVVKLSELLAEASV